MDPITRTGGNASRVVPNQANMVADSLLRDRGRDVYRRRLLGGVGAAVVREAVRTAVMDSLANPERTYADAAESGAIAADRALAKVGIEVERVGSQRMGWRGRLAHVLLTLDEGDSASAAVELRALIDGIYEAK